MMWLLIVVWFVLTVPFAVVVGRCIAAGDARTCASQEAAGTSAELLGTSGMAETA